MGNSSDQPVQASPDVQTILGDIVRKTHIRRVFCGAESTRVEIADFLAIEFKRMDPDHGRPWLEAYLIPSEPLTMVDLLENVRFVFACPKDEHMTVQLTDEGRLNPLYCDHLSGHQLFIERR